MAGSLRLTREQLAIITRGDPRAIKALEDFFATLNNLGSHHATHEPGGSDPMAVDAAAAVGSLRTLGVGAAQAAAGNHNHKLDDLTAPDDNTDLDATAAAHGLLPKLSGIASDGLRGDGTWGAPGGASKGHLHGLVLSNGADATNDIDIAAGEAVDNSDAELMVLASALTKQLDAAWAVGTNAGGRDTGAIADGWWAVWLIKRTDTGVVDALFSLSASAPSMPASYTKKRRIGWVYRSGGALVAFVQSDDLFELSSPVLDVNVTNPGTAAVLRAMTAPPLSRAIVNWNVLAVANQFVLYVSDPATTDMAASATAAPLGAVATQTGAGNLGGFAQVTTRTNSSSQVRTRISASGVGDAVRGATIGWIDTRGRLA